MVWFSLGIPVVFAAIMFFRFKRRVSWWELVVPMLLSVGLIYGAKSLTEYIQCSDTEYWTGWVVKAEYWEHWNELHEWDETVTETSGSGKNARTTTRIVHHSDIIDHPPTWNVIDNNGISQHISSSEFERLAGKWKNRGFIRIGHGYTIHGDKYETNYSGSDDLMEVVTTTHTYQNRIQASESVFKFRKPPEQEKAMYGLVDYPQPVGYHAPTILGAVVDPVAERKLAILNAKKGKGKQIKVWIIVYQEQPMDAAISQMNYWEGGNKNELVLTVGIDKEQNVDWGYVFSWTDREIVKVEARDLITNQKKLNLSEIVTKLEPLIENQWERKHFKDFNYLSVEPPLWSTILIFFLVLGSNVGLAVFFSKVK
jgi:hypothetical protein